MPFNSLLRITILQLLRSIGFDKAPPQAIDILTDLYIRHLQLLVQETLMLSRARGSEDLEIQDITQAMINLKMLQPSDVLDVYEQHENYSSLVSANYSLNNGTADFPSGEGSNLTGVDQGMERVPNVGGLKGAREFLLWVVGNVPDRARTVSRPTVEMLQSANGTSANNTNGTKSNKNVIPEYMNALNEIGENEQQQNTASPGDPLGHVPQGITKQLETVEVTEEDWLTYVMKKSSKLGTVDGKFKNTVLMDGQLRSDYKVAGPVIEELESKLPYNIRYEDDDMYYD